MLVRGYTRGLLQCPPGPCCGSLQCVASALGALATFRVAVQTAVPALLLVPCSLLPKLGGHVATACGLCDLPPFQIGWSSEGGDTHVCLCLCRGVEVGSLDGLRLTEGSLSALGPPCLPSRQVLGAELRLCFSLSLPPPALLLLRLGSRVSLSMMSSLGQIGRSPPSSVAGLFPYKRPRARCHCGPAPSARCLCAG